MNANDERCQPDAIIQCASGRVYEVVRREDRVYENYGRAGGTLGDGVFVALSLPSACPSCGTVTPHSTAERGRVGWVSAEQVERSVLVPLPECPDVFPAVGA